MRELLTVEGYKALWQLEERGKDLSYEEIGSLLVTAYPEITVHVFVSIFLLFVARDRFDSDTGHVDCPIACVEMALAYQRAGGRFIPYS